ALVDARNLVAAEAAQLADQVVPLDELRGLDSAAVADQVGDLVVALETAGLGEPLGVHREVPEVDRLPAVLRLPAVPLERVVGRVHGVHEPGGAALAAVAGGAAELLGRVRA